MICSRTSVSFLTYTLNLPDDSSILDTTPSISDIVAFPFGILASNNSSTRGRPCVISAPATPPEWNVLMVNCVPGSPIDWAPIVPTASPTSTILPVAKLRP